MPKTHECTDTDTYFMRECLYEAQKAQAQGEIPIGALIVDPQLPYAKQAQILARAHNSPISQHNPCAHAEILVLQACAQERQNYRLTGLTLYTTLEPCTMCAGAIAHARIGRVVFGAYDEKGGAIVNGVQFFNQPTCLSKINITSGILQAECSEILKQFFRVKRG